MEKETLCDKCKKAQPSHSCQDITALGRCYIEGINTSNKVKPKFDVGDCVVNKNGTVQQILSYKNGIYKHTNGYSSKMFEDEWRLWDVTKDAKEGDVLAIDPWSDYPSSFVAIYKKQYGEDFDSYCFVGFDGKFYKGEKGHSTEEIHPATKEQRDLLFSKMHEAGYMWDSKKKELKKIEPFDKYEGLTDFERTLADICIGWIGEEPGWEQYIKDNADVLLKIAIKQRIGGE